MKINALVIIIAVSLFIPACSKDTKQIKAKADMVENTVVEAACGQCLFGMEGDGCDLAVRIDGKAYFVDGTNIDEHGDAHSDEGFCNAISHARVTGKIENGKFLASDFELVQ